MDAIPLMVKEWGDDLPECSIVLLLHEKFVGLTSPLLASQQQIECSTYPNWVFHGRYSHHMLLFFWSSEHTWRKNQFCLETVPPSLSFLTLWEHRSLKLKVPVYHWPAQPACSRTYFTLVSGLRRPPRSFVCLHMLGFSVPTLPEGLHHNGSWPSSEGTLPLGVGVQLFLISERIYSTCSASAAEVQGRYEVCLWSQKDQCFHVLGGL